MARGGRGGALTRATVELPVQVNGKVRARVTVAVDATADDVLAAALADERVRGRCAGGRCASASSFPVAW